MTTFLNLQDRIVNLDCIARARFDPAKPGGKERYDEDTGQTYTSRPCPAHLLLTLTSVEMDLHIDDFERSGYHKSAASIAETVTVSGALAEQTWLWLCRNSVDPTRAQYADD